MIQVATKGLAGFAIHPNVGSAERSEIIAALPEAPRAAFIDLAPTRDVLEFVSQLEEAAGVVVIAFYDHHLDPRRSAEVANARELERKLGKRAKIVARREAPSCPRLIEVGKWEKIGSNVVLFHADFDGFLGFLKGAGVLYPEMEDDADLLDGAGNGRRLSAIGKLLADAHEFLVPYFSQDPAGHQREKQRVYQTLADWIAEGLKPEAIKAFAEEVRQATDEAECLAHELAWLAKPLPGRVVICNFLPYIRAGKPIAIPTWKREILRRFGPVLLCSIGTGHLGEQVYIELPKAWQGQVDLRDFLPERVQGRVPFRVQVPVDRWPEFLAKWQRRLPDAE